MKFYQIQSLISYLLLFLIKQINSDQNSISIEISQKNVFPKAFLKKKKFIEVSEKLKLDIVLLDKGMFHVRITDKSIPRFEVPRDILNWNAFNSSLNITENGLVIPNKSLPLNFFFESSKNNPVFEFLSENFILSTYFLSFSYKLTSDLIFGYGERAHKFKLNEGIYTTWLNDTTVGTTLDDEKGGRNLYGHQPFLLNRDKNGHFLGLLFINSNAQDLIVSKAEQDGSVKLEQRSIGGIIEFVVILDENPSNLIKRYHSFVGLPVLPPFWALGWHQSRYGYENGSVVDDVVNKYKELNLPLDTIWTDINYMNNFRDFTVDPDKFANLPSLVDKWHKDNVKFVPIVDLGIFYDNNNTYYQLGLKYECFIMSNYTKKPLQSEIWPGKVAFPDFTNPNSKLFWEKGLSDLNDQVKFDGLWLDVNEPQSLVKYPYGEISNTYDSALNKYNSLPYKIGIGRIELEHKGISLNAMVYGGGPENDTFNTMYNYKPINPYYQNKRTNIFFTQILGKRSFIISRANLFGMGKYTNHWLGDNLSTYEQMRLSIPGIFNFQMFGFNLVGADICGFLLNATDPLCARWHILGAFYPFSRNHNNINQTDQEPYAIGDLTLNSTRIALRLKYALLRYTYTNLFFISMKGGMYFQPIFFQFPQEEEAYNHLDDQIMLGKDILFTPALGETDQEFDAYFPNCHWNDLISGKSFIDFNETNVNGRTVKLSGEYFAVHLHLRGGSIIPFQNTSSNVIMRSNQLSNISTELIINPDQEFKASGSIIYDDGISLETIKNKNYIHIDISMNDTKIDFKTVNFFDGYYNNDNKIHSITIYRGKRWNGYNNVEVKNLKGEIINIEKYYDKKLDSFKIIFVNIVEMNNIQSVVFNN